MQPGFAESTMTFFANHRSRLSLRTRIVLLAGLLPLPFLVAVGYFGGWLSYSQAKALSFTLMGGAALLAYATRARDADQPVRRFELRDATPADFETLYPIHVAAMRDYVEQTWGWDDEVQHRFWREHWFPDREVIEVDGELAGFLDVEDREDHVWVGNIELHPRFQHQGIDTVILRDIQAAAARRRLGVRLEVLKVNPARKLYERLGFIQVCETETHHEMVWPSVIARVACRG